MKPVAVCPHCQAKMVEYKFSLNTGLVACLYKMKKAEGRAEVSELGLTNSQYVNFQKLAWWGLVVKVVPDDETEKRRGGQWAITKRGGKFLRGEIQLQKYVHTYRGKVQSFSGPMIWVTDVKDGYKYKMDYAEEAVPRTGGR